MVLWALFFYKGFEVDELEDWYDGGGGSEYVSYVTVFCEAMR